VRGGGAFEQGWPIIRAFVTDFSPKRENFVLGAKPAFANLTTFQQMNWSQKHLRSRAGSSITKAEQQCCAQMRPVGTNWNKSNTGPGSQA